MGVSQVEGTTSERVPDADAGRAVGAEMQARCNKGLGMRAATLRHMATRPRPQPALSRPALLTCSAARGSPRVPFSITPDNLRHMESQRGSAADLALRSAPSGLRGPPGLGGGPPWLGFRSEPVGGEGVSAWPAGVQPTNTAT
jgi:hypothetical protein